LTATTSLDIDVGEALPINIQGLYPIHEEERQWIWANGLEAFWRLDWDPYDVARPSATPHWAPAYGRGSASSSRTAPASSLEWSAGDVAALASAGLEAAIALRGRSSGEGATVDRSGADRFLGAARCLRRVGEAARVELITAGEPWSASPAHASTVVPA
jgi:hypothetical protein